VLRPTSSRRIVLSTNVAETSLTVPGVTAVVDSGLVHQTRYHYGRSYLACVPIAEDAARQRAGRAGRLGPGVAYRLWTRSDALKARTPPEILRESLVQTLLMVGHLGLDVASLPWPDPPKPFAVEDALRTLRQWDAVDATGQLTELGRTMATLPVDAALAKLLMVGAATDAAHEVIDLVAALSSRRPLLRPRGGTEPLHDAPCDACQLIGAVRWGDASKHGVDAQGLREARRLRARLLTAWGLDPFDGALRPEPLYRALASAWPQACHVARRRKRHVAWSAGSTEAQLAKGSHVSDAVEALIALEVSGVEGRHNQRDVLIRRAAPASKALLFQAGRGTTRFGDTRFVDGVLHIEEARVFAGATLHAAQRPVTPEDGLEVVARVVKDNRWRRGLRERFAERRALRQLGAALGLHPFEDPGDPNEADTWLKVLTRLGVSEADDLDLLDPEDLLPSPPPSDVADTLERSFPRTLSLGSHRYAVSYVPGAKEVVLIRTQGRKGHVPDMRYLPRWAGWRVVLQEASNRKVLRSRR